MKRKEKNITDQEVIKSLPHNRKELFFDLLKHRKMTLFAISCFTFMFFIPLAVDLFFFNVLETAAESQGLEDQIFSLFFYSMLIMLPCVLIGFLGFAGAFHTIKKLVWQEDVSVPVDFFNGIKENWKHAIINGFIFSIILFGFSVGTSYLLMVSSIEPVWCGIGIGALILVLLFFGMVISLYFTICVYYQNSVAATFKNAFAFLGLTNWRVLLVFLFSTGVVITLCFLNMMVTIAIGLFLFAVLNSVVIVLYTLIAHSAFDKYINKEHYPDYVGKGLYKVETNDTKEA